MYTTLTMKYGCGSIILWGWFFSAWETGSLIKVDGGMKKELYIQPLCQSLKQFTENPWLKNQWTFQQGNKQKHVSTLAKKWFLGNDVSCKVIKTEQTITELRNFKKNWSVSRHGFLTIACIVLTRKPSSFNDLKTLRKWSGPKSLLRILTEI